VEETSEKAVEELAKWKKEREKKRDRDRKKGVKEIFAKNSQGNSKIKKRTPMPKRGS
jgi:hypothetical protein